MRVRWVLAVFLSSTVAPASAFAQATSSPSFEIQAMDGRCVQVYGGQATVGAPIQLNTCGNAANNIWRYENHEFIGLGKMCLQAWGGIPGHVGTPIKLNVCSTTGTPAANNSWKFTESYRDAKFIEGEGGRCLQVYGGFGQAGLGLNQCGPAANNAWRLIDPSTGNAIPFPKD